MSSRRLDFLVCAQDRAGRDQAVIIELKQWKRVEESDAGPLSPPAWGRMRDVLHPSVQVGQYQQYLKDNNSAFYDGNRPVGLDACCYLHNYTARKDDVLLAPKFEKVLREYKLYDSTQWKNCRVSRNGYLRVPGRPFLRRWRWKVSPKSKANGALEQRNSSTCALGPLTSKWSYTKGFDMQFGRDWRTIESESSSSMAALALANPCWR